jgi:predicted RNA-binding Zn ribbon-like protein
METKRVERMLLVGGHPALDFVNTLAGLLSRGPQPGDEHLRSYGDLLAFSLRAGTLSQDSASRLERAARGRPRQAEAALRGALELRALCDDAFRPLAAGSRPRDRVLRALRRSGEEALRHAELAPDGAGYAWRWEDARELEAPLWPLAHTALELLTGGPLERLKCCGRCRWLFLDVSKNRSRRWCSMQECGTDEKKERYVRRRRARHRPQR